MGRHNEYQTMGSDALWLRSKGTLWFVCGWSPYYTHARPERFRNTLW